MNLIDILIVILLIIASVLGLYLIKLIRRLFVTIDIVETEIKELDQKLTPLISDLQEMVDNSNYITNFAKEKVDVINGVIDGIKNKFGGFAPQKIDRSSPQSNALNLVTNLKAIFKGTTTFINELKK